MQVLFLFVQISQIVLLFSNFHEYLLQFLEYAKNNPKHTA